METSTLKQKLGQSRALATTLKNRIFMRTLYQLLEVIRFGEVFSLANSIFLRTHQIIRLSLGMKEELRFLWKTRKVL